MNLSKNDFVLSVLVYYFDAVINESWDLPALWIIFVWSRTFSNV